MKNIKILIVIVSILLVGCSKINFETGIKGSVKYGKGDCMPTVGGKKRQYENYNKDLFFIVKEELESLGDGDFDQLKNKSIAVSIKKGKLSTELPIGTYIVITEDVKLTSQENTITIKPGEVLKKDFKFWECTTY